MSLEEEIFQDALSLLGNPINDWKFTGIEFNDDTPHIRYHPETGQISISLSKRAEENNIQYVFQLTHELCHLFYPKIEYPSLFEHRTLTINEGISTYFSIKTTGRLFDIEDHLKNDLKENSSNYFYAFELVDRLLAFDPYAILKLRDQQPRVDLLNKKDFIKAGVEVDTKLIELLLNPFK